MCVCLSSGANCLLAVVFPCIGSGLPVPHTEGGVPRGYPAFASSVTSHLLVTHRRVVPVLVGHTHTHTLTHRNTNQPTAVGSADTPRGHKHNQWSRMQLMRSRFSSFRDEYALYMCVYMGVCVRQHCGIVKLQCRCSVVLICVCVGGNLSTVLPQPTVIFFPITALPI